MLKIEKTKIEKEERSLDVDFPVYIQLDKITFSKLLPEFYDYDSDNREYIVEVRVVTPSTFDHHEKRIMRKKHKLFHDKLHEDQKLISALENFEENQISEEEFEEKFNDVKSEIDHYS